MRPRGEGTMAKRILILSDRVGSGDEELGRLLMRNLLYAVARNDEPPAAVMLMNGGVRLACEGSESLDDLRLLAEKGVPVRVCGTCLDFLGLKESLSVGDVGAMPDSVAALLGADDIVTIA
ncbi:MAG: sulfurtransferase-like selenium metabolism protein YedF [Coriobacteriaceae bacterium]|nr:sulfurtransferase-like selenium metabolism protein YedF [Coriobacteriaceae bacterium]